MKLEMDLVGEKKVSLLKKIFLTLIDGVCFFFFFFGGGLGVVIE